MMPAIYGNAYDITQGPGFVAIRYEMIHEARIIPLDGRPHLPGDRCKNYMGDARGRWEGNTLVVETTNFHAATAFRGASEKLKVTERFTPIMPTRFDGKSASTIPTRGSSRGRTRCRSSATPTTRPTSTRATKATAGCEYSQRGACGREGQVGGKQ